MQISNQPITWQQQGEDDLNLKPNTRMREKSDLSDFSHKSKFYREGSEKQKQTNTQKTYPMSGSSLGKNTLMKSEEKGQTASR